MTLNRAHVAGVGLFDNGKRPAQSDYAGAVSHCLRLASLSRSTDNKNAWLNQAQRNAEIVRRLNWAPKREGAVYENRMG